MSAALLPRFGGVAQGLLGAQREIAETRRRLCQLARHMHRNVMDAEVIEPFLEALDHLENAEVDVESAAGELEHDTRSDANVVAGAA